MEGEDPKNAQDMTCTSIPVDDESASVKNYQYETVDENYLIPEPVENPSIPRKRNETKSDKNEDEIDPCGGPLGYGVEVIWNFLDLFIKSLGVWTKYLFVSVVWLLILAYIFYAIYKSTQSGVIDWCNGYGLSYLLFVVILWSVLYYYFIRPFLIPLLRNSHCLECLNVQRVQQICKYLRYIIIAIIIIVFICFVGFDTAKEPSRLTSLCGVVFFFVGAFLLSKHPRFVNWSTVLSGFALHLLIALLTVRWDVGRSIVSCFANKVVHFLEFAYEGAAFAYGDLLVHELKLFAFQSLSVLFFLSMVVQILFYYGWLQAACFKVGSIIQYIVGTTICESVNAASIPFLGMSEAPLLYKAYLSYMTPSEIHAVMTGGFASCAGSLFAAYTSLGVDPTNLITAASMAGPCSLYMSKLFYPENIKSKTSSDNMELIKSTDESVMSAACKGASSAIEIIQGIIANVIACVALIAFFNAIINWFGVLVGVEGLSFDFILGKIFIPLAWLMGVQPSECETVGMLVGLKTAVNEFVAYKKLGELKKAGLLSFRSEAIATFALCGFANPSSLSLLISFLCTLCPEQKSTVINLSFRALLAGSCTSFMAASIVGLLTPENAS